MAYIKGQRQPPDGCVFCNKNDCDDATELVLARSQYVYVTLNLFPYSNGHLMIVPYEHVATQEDMPVEGLTDMMVMVNKAIAVLRAAYSPHAFNLGANIGKAASADAFPGAFHDVGIRSGAYVDAPLQIAQFVGADHGIRPH